MNSAIPFRGAILDLDGTVLDSLGVWRHVDERFFGARGLEIPPDYVRAIAGMSFSETAEYTVRACGLEMSVEAVMEAWMALAADEYAHDVELVAGARDYLRMLKRAGVRLAAATANRRALVEPALERCGIRELFDAVLTTGDIGDRNKSDGALFRMAAQRLGLVPAECVVFEDTLEGVRGARAAGMGAIAVKSASCAMALDAIAPLCDAVVDDYTAMTRVHPCPDNARRCVIFTAHCEGDPSAAYIARPGDWVLCADGGWQVARRAGIAPDAVLGDFDSSDVPEHVQVERFPVEKDDTDTMLCLKKGFSLGFDDFLIVGGFGGRVDHTLANFQALHYAARRGVHAEMADGRSWASAVMDGRLRVPADVVDASGGGVKLSVFALTDACRGVDIRGAKWTLSGATLTNAFPLGLSNAFTAPEAEIAVAEGALLVTVCGD